MDAHFYLQCGVWGIVSLLTLVHLVFSLNRRWVSVAELAAVLYSLQQIVGKWERGREKDLTWPQMEPLISIHTGHLQPPATDHHTR